MSAYIHIINFRKTCTQQYLSQCYSEMCWRGSQVSRNSIPWSNLIQIPNEFEGFKVYAQNIRVTDV